MSRNNVELSALIPTESFWNWKLQGACREVDPALFFHPSGEKGKARISRATAAAAVCAGCVVLQECRDYSFTAQEPYGTWGGVSEDERALVLSRLRRGSSPTL